MEIPRTGNEQGRKYVGPLPPEEAAFLFAALCARGISIAGAVPGYHHHQRHRLPRRWDTGSRYVAHFLAYIQYSKRAGGRGWHKERDAGGGRGAVSRACAQLVTGSFGTLGTAASGKSLLGF